MTSYTKGFQSKYDGRCGNCGEPFSAGEWIEKVNGRYQPIEHIGRCERAEAPKPQPQATSDGQAVIARLQAAKAHLQYPKIRVLFTDDEDARFQAYRIVFRLKGAKAKAPGTVDIVAPDDEVETHFGWGARWLGKIELDGSLVLSGYAQKTSLGSEIQKMLGGFEEYLAANGRLTGVCCYCGRPLSDERSTAVGYGPVCASHFGLPWGESNPAPAPKSDDPTWTDSVEATAQEKELEVLHARIFAATTVLSWPAKSTWSMDEIQKAYPVLNEHVRTMAEQLFEVAKKVNEERNQAQGEKDELEAADALTGPTCADCGRDDGTHHPANEHTDAERARIRKYWEDQDQEPDLRARLLAKFS